jgi:hypothetical protein
MKGHEGFFSLCSSRPPWIQNCGYASIGLPGAFEHRLPIGPDVFQWDVGGDGVAGEEYQRCLVLAKAHGPPDLGADILRRARLENATFDPCRDLTLQDLASLDVAPESEPSQGEEVVT